MVRPDLVLIKQYFDEIHIRRNAPSPKYKTLEDDRTFYGEIPGLQGVYANQDTLEATREQLAEVLEDWILLRLSMNLPIPAAVDGIEFSV